MKFIVLAVLVAGALYIFFQQKKKKRQPPEQRPAVPDQTPPSAGDEYELILKSLLELNLLIRKDVDLDPKTMGKIETIMDDLMAVIPAMMERYPSETLTYELKKIGREHLYKTVKEYLDLSLESRENQADIFNRTIENLHEVCTRARSIVEKNETAEFKTMANFLSGKFS